MSAVLKIFDGLCPNEKSEPDHITLDNFDLDRFSEDFVISRDIHGRIISLYKDDIWDFSHYNVHTSRVSKINFEARFKTIKSKHEAKKLMLIILLFSSGRNNSSISFNTITSYMGDFIDPFVNYANLDNSPGMCLLYNRVNRMLIKIDFFIIFFIPLEKRFLKLNNNLVGLTGFEPVTKQL